MLSDSLRENNNTQEQHTCFLSFQRTAVRRVEFGAGREEEGGRKLAGETAGQGMAWHGKTRNRRQA